MPEFSVPSGCRQAMTSLHNAHNERYNRVLNRLQQMHINQKEDHRLISAFVDTHHVLHGAVKNALKHSGEDMPDSVKSDLEAASTHAADVHSSLIGKTAKTGKTWTDPTGKKVEMTTTVQRRGAGIGREMTPGGKPVGSKMAGNIVGDPQTHLHKIMAQIALRRPFLTPKTTK